MKTMMTTLTLVLVAAVAGADTVGPLSTYLVEPCRFLDTRESQSSVGSGPFVGKENRVFVLQGNCGVPVGAVAAVLNVTVTGATTDGYLELWRADAYNPPNASAINFTKGTTIANGMTVRLGQAEAGGLFADLWVFAHAAGGEVHVIIDVVGYLR